MKRILFITALVLGLLSCQKEELPTVQGCNKGIITEKGLKIEEENTFVVDGERVTHTRYGYYIWIIDECSGETVRKEVYDWEYNQLEKGDYFDKNIN